MTIKQDKSAIVQVVLFVGVSSVIMLLSVFESVIRANNMIMYFFFLICQLFCCLLIIFMQITFIGKTQVEVEKAVIEQLCVRDHEQFQQLKDNLEIINIKCHDIRHSLLGEKVVCDREAENAVNEYDSVMNTGNAALDIVLTEKSLRCGLKKILFTCIADGKAIAFMSKSDICTLFGNAIENAIESEEKIEEEKRFISVTVKETGNFVSVHIENYFKGELKLFDGLPVTDKEDENVHGFGMKSIRHTVEKYGGVISVATQDEMFQLDCLFSKRSTN